MTFIIVKLVISIINATHEQLSLYQDVNIAFVNRSNVLKKTIRNYLQESVNHKGNPVIYLDFQAAFDNGPTCPYEDLKRN